MSGTNSFYYFLKFLEKKLKGHFNFENIKTQNVESFFFFLFSSITLVKRYFCAISLRFTVFFSSRRICHFRSPLHWCVSFYGLFSVVAVVVFLLLLSLLLNVFWLCFLHLNDPKRRLMKEDYRRLY